MVLCWNERQGANRTRPLSGWTGLLAGTTDVCGIYYKVSKMILAVEKYMEAMPTGRATEERLKGWKGHELVYNRTYISTSLKCSQESQVNKRCASETRVVTDQLADSMTCFFYSTRSHELFAPIHFIIILKRSRNLMKNIIMSTKYVYIYWNIIII